MKRSQKCHIEKDEGEYSWRWKQLGKPLVESSNLSALTKKNLLLQGFFCGKVNEPNLRYTKSMPITIARFGQNGQCEWANTLVLDAMDEEIKN